VACKDYSPATPAAQMTWWCQGPAVGDVVEVVGVIGRSPTAQVALAPPAASQHHPATSYWLLQTDAVVVFLSRWLGPTQASLSVFVDGLRIATPRPQLSQRVEL
jgi:hypothetical protein